VIRKRRRPEGNKNDEEEAVKLERGGVRASKNK